MRVLPRRLSALLALFLSLTAASVLHAATVDLPRFPSISPDASHIVFSWRGDLWKVGANGGHAERLTSHPAEDLRSQWTDDGASIVFTSTRAGGTNLFAMNPDATTVRQITHEDNSLSLNDIHPDGSRIYISARREGDTYRAARPYSVPATGGPIQRVHDAFSDESAISPDASRMLITRGWQSFTRKGYRGGDSRNVYLFDTRTNAFAPITNRRGHDGFARWKDNDSILFLSDRNNDSTLNVFSLTLPGTDANAQQLTDFTGDGVQWLDISADGSTAVIHVWDTLYTLDLTRTGASPVPLTITASADEADDFTLRDIASDVSQAALSPDGQVMAYVAYGNVYVRNTDEDSPTRRITEGEAHEHSIAWSPDNTILYFCSDENGVSDIYSATVALTRSEIVEQFEETTGTTLNPLAKDKSDDKDEADDDADDDEDKDSESHDHPAAGVWSGSYKGPAGQFPPDGIPFTLTIWSLGDDSFKGTVTAMGSTQDISSVKWDDGELSFSAPDDEGGSVTVTGNVNDQSMTGSWSSEDGSMSGTFSADRTGDPPADDDADDDGSDDEDEDSPADRWHDAIQFAIEPLVLSPHNDREPHPSPDGTMLAFYRERGDIMILDLETNETETFRKHWHFWSEFVWAPDSKHFAYSTSDLDFNADVWIEPIDHSWPAVNLTKHPDYDGEPSFSADGRVLAFISDRINNESDVWAVFLDKDLEGLTDTDLKQYFKDAASAVKKRKPLEAKNDDGDIEAEDAELEDKEADEESDEDEAADEEEEEELNLADIWDLDDAYLRLQRVTSLNGEESNAQITLAGDRVVFTGNHGGAYLFSAKLDGSDRKELGASGSVQHISLTGDRVIVVRGGQAATVSPEGGSDESHPISDTIRIDLQEQAAQKFTEAARTLGDIFYHPQMKGTDWPALSAKYLSLARQSRTPSEFGHIGAWFIGELSASHLGIYPPGEELPNSRSNGRLAIDAEPTAAGFIVKRVIDEGPAAAGSMRLLPGDVITEIEFAPFGPSDTIESHLKDRTGEETVLTISRAIEGSDEPATLHVFVEPVSYSADSYLRYNQWQRDNAAKASEWSGGRIGYLHIRAMGQSDLYEFERDLYAAGEGKDALIIDVRNNGGGWTADRVMASLSVTPHAYTIPRGASDEDTSGYPRDRLFIQRYVKPVNMMCNEKSFSNAEIVSHAFKTLKRGTLVGQETHGSVISTSGFSLIDDTWVRLPFRGWYLNDGTDMENHGAVPHIIVPQTPEDEEADHDAQLKAAVDDLLLRLN